MQRSQARGDLSTVIVRPPWFYGPFQPDRQTQFFAAIRRGRFPCIGDGSQRRSMVYTGNLVDALLLAEVVPAADGRAYWIADAEPYALRDVLQTVRDALRRGRISRIARGGPRVPRFAAAAAAHVDRRAPGHRPLRAGGACARRVEGHDRVRHHAARGASSATSRQSACSRGCAPASGGAGNGARRSDGSFGAHHGRERVLRHRARGARGRRG